MKFTAWFIRAEGWYIGITWNRENACCWLRQGLAMALPPEDLNAVQTLLPGMGQGWGVPANCIFLMEKAHFQVFSRFAFTGPSLISAESDVEIHSLLAWCMGRAAFP